MSECIINDVVEKILLYGYGNNIQKLKTILYDKVNEKYLKREKLGFVMPAFPGKSPNCNSSFSFLPDYTENVSLETINDFITEINKIYPYGCEFTIVHDGHFFSYVGITRGELELNEYILSFRKKCGEWITSVTIYDLMNSCDLYEAYLLFKNKYLDEMISIGDLSNEILFTRNEFGDKIFKNGLSNNQKQKIATNIARKSVLIKNGINNMINDLFPDSIRLSVHFQDKGSVKMGFKLIPFAINKGTPWFYVAYVSSCGKIILGKNDWYFESKKISTNKYGNFYSISDNDIYLFENNLVDRKIIRERRYNR